MLGGVTASQVKALTAESLRFPPQCQSSEGESRPKDNHAYGHGKPMDSRLIFLHRVRMLRKDGRHNVRHLIGLVSLALDRLPGKSGSATSRQTKSPQGGI
jgi:hypothetical protein